MLSRALEEKACESFEAFTCKSYSVPYYAIGVPMSALHSDTYKMHSTHMYIYIYMYIYTIHVHMYMYTCTCTCTYMYMYMYVFMCKPVLGEDLSSV